MSTTEHTTEHTTEQTTEHLTEGTGRAARSAGPDGVGTDHVRTDHVGKADPAGAAGTDVLGELDGVTRRYGDVTALDGVSVRIRRGDLLGMMGPNGAGKTTAINLLTGLRRPDSGTVRLFGEDPRRPAARRGIGVTPQETGLPSTLRVGECVDYVAAHHADPVDRAELLGRFGLDGLERRQTGGLSGGQRRRLAVALAFVGRPRLVFLDEPTTGLDVEARSALWNGIREFHRDGGTVVLTSHYLEEIEALADRVVVLGEGRVLADDRVGRVRDLVRSQRVSVTVPEDGADAALPQLAGVSARTREGDRLHLITPDADELVRQLVRCEVPFTGLEVRPSSLEEAFLALTSGGGGRG